MHGKCLIILGITAARVDRVRRSGLEEYVFGGLEGPHNYFDKYVH